MRLLQESTSKTQLISIEYESTMRFYAYERRLNSVQQHLSEFMISDDPESSEAELRRLLKETQALTLDMSIEELKNMRRLTKLGILKGQVYGAEKLSLMNQVRLTFEPIHSRELCLAPESKPGICVIHGFDCDVEAVTGISGQSIDRTVEYTWGCFPTGTARALGNHETQETRTARFTLYDDGWRVIETDSARSSELLGE